MHPSDELFLLSVRSLAFEGSRSAASPTRTLGLQRRRPLRELSLFLDARGY